MRKHPRQTVLNVIPEKALENISNSYDIVGDIAV
jgi:hypothetical protein